MRESRLWTTLSVMLAYRLLLALALFASTARALEKEDALVPQTLSSSLRKYAFSPDGSLMAAGGYDRLTRLWSVRTGKVLRVIGGYDDNVTGLAFTPDGKTLVTASYQGLVLWTDVETGRELHRDHTITESVRDIVISPDGRSLFVSSGLTLWRWNLASRTIEAKKKPGGFYPENLRFSPDGKSLVGLRDALVLVEPNTLDIVKTIPVKIPIDSSAVFEWSPDRSSVAVACGSSILIHDWEHPEKPQTQFAASSPEGYGKLGQIMWTPKRTILASYQETPSLVEWDAASTGYAPKPLRTIPLSGKVENHFFVSSGKQVVGINNQSTRFFVHDALTGSAIVDMEVPTAMDLIMRFRPGTHALTLGMTPDRTLDFDSGEGLQPLAAQSPIVNWTSDGKRFATIKPGSEKQDPPAVTIQIWDAEEDQVAREVALQSLPERLRLPPRIYTTPESLAPVFLSADGTRLLSTTFKEIVVWETASGRLLRRLPYPFPVTSGYALSPDGKLLVTMGDISTLSGGVRIFDVDTGAVVEDFAAGKPAMDHPTISRDGRLVVWNDYNRIYIHDLVTKKTQQLTAEVDSGFTGIGLSADGLLIVGAEPSGHLRLWSRSPNDDRWTVQWTLEVQAGLWRLQISTDNQFLIARSVSGTSLLLNLKNYELARLIVSGNDWILYTPDGYFDGSRNGGRLLAMVRGTSAYGVDQFATARNRPDLVMERLGLGTPALRSYDKALFLKRLRRLGLTEQQLTTEIVAPDATIDSAIPNGKFVELKAHCQDPKGALKRYSIFVNDVPLHGAQGVAVKGASTSIQERVELTEGNNKIEVSCSNAAGAESFRALISQRYETQTRHELYYLGFGVSTYTQPGLTLSYAHKDAADLGALFQSRHEGFQAVHVKTFLNEQVTPQAISLAKEFVAKAGPDDMLVLFIAGHGVHDADAEATYYYLVSNSDPANLAATAVTFDSIEELLQGVPPRQKLFLMDTCESGERDENAPTLTASAESTKVHSRGIKRIGTSSAATTTTPPRTYLQARDRFIENDLLRRSGAVVFSSSRGGELSYEDDQLRNGYFTAKIVEGLSQPVADRNGDQRVSMDELREFVAKGVSERSHGLQNPTIDRDNISANIVLNLKSSGPTAEDKPAPKSKRRR